MSLQAPEGAVGGQQRKGAGGNSSAPGRWVSQPGRHRGWKESQSLPLLGQLQGTPSRFLSHLFHPSFHGVPPAVSRLMLAQKGYRQARNCPPASPAQGITCKFKGWGKNQLGNSGAACSHCQPHGCDLGQAAVHKCAQAPRRAPSHPKAAPSQQGEQHSHVLAPAPTR